MSMCFVGSYWKLIKNIVKKKRSCFLNHLHVLYPFWIVTVSVFLSWTFPASAASCVVSLKSLLCILSPFPSSTLTLMFVSGWWKWTKPETDLLKESLSLFALKGLITAETKQVIKTEEYSHSLNSLVWMWSTFSPNLIWGRQISALRSSAVRVVSILPLNAAHAATRPHENKTFQFLNTCNWQQKLCKRCLMSAVGVTSQSELRSVITCHTLTVFAHTEALQLLLLVGERFEAQAAWKTNTLQLYLKS